MTWSYLRGGSVKELPALLLLAECLLEVTSRVLQVKSRTAGGSSGVPEFRELRPMLRGPRRKRAFSRP